MKKYLLSFLLSMGFSFSSNTLNFMTSHLFYIGNLYKFMSILRDLGVFLISALFTFSIFMAVTSYTLGDLMQKENLKDFIESSLAPNLMEDQCEEFCMNFTGEQKQACGQICIEQLGNRTDQGVGMAIDEVYEKEFYGVSVNQIAYVLQQFTLFVIISVVSCVLILILSEDPLGHIGKNLITISISLFIASFSPNLIMSFSNLPVEELLSDYLGSGLDQQTIIAIVFISVGIALVIANYLVKRKKKTVKKLNPGFSCRTNCNTVKS